MVKYLHSTEIESISACHNDRFFVRVFDAEKTAALHNETPWRKGEKRYSYYMMDKLGRIFGERIDSFEMTSSPRQDGFFEIKIDDTKLLIDKDQNIISSGFYEIDEFASNGVALIEKPRGKKYLTNLDGSVFSDEYLDYGPFVNGLAAVKLSNGKWSFVDEAGVLQNCSFDLVQSFYNEKYTIAVIDSQQFVIDRNFQVVSGPYPSIMWIDENDIIAVYDDKQELKYSYHNISGAQIGPRAKMIHGFDYDMARIDTGEGYALISQKTGFLITPEIYKSAENFFGKMTVVFLGFDERDEHIFKFVRNDGVSSQTFTSAGMVGENLGIAFVEGKNGKGGKFHYINENFELSKKGFSRLSGFSEGVSHYECKKDRYTYLHDDLERFEKDFDRVSNFSGGFGIVFNDGRYDAINKNEILLSEISRVAQKIEESPLSFMEIPEAFYVDEELIEMLYELACVSLMGKTDLQEQELKDQSRRILSFKQKILDDGKMLRSKKQKLK